MAAAVAAVAVATPGAEAAAAVGRVLQVLSAAALLQVSVPALLAAARQPAPGAALVPVAALEVSMFTVDAHFLDAASVAVAVAAEAVGAAELAGYGHPPGVGSTPAGPNLHLQVKKLASRRSKSNKRCCLRKRSSEAS
jgi:hypothetical protein